MSIFSAITKRSKLNALIKQSAEARKSEEVKAKQLFKGAYPGFAEVVMDDPLRAEALYNWGLALLHHAKMTIGDEAVKLYQDSFNKFTFCLMLDPNYLAAAIDSGVACMDLARVQGVGYHHELYENARKQFEKANAIQSGAASYNLACIYGLRGSSDACLKALETSRDKGLLPDAEEILNDPDLSGVVGQDWFDGFMSTLKKNPEPDMPTEAPVEAAPEAEKIEAQTESAAEAPATEETKAEPASETAAEETVNAAEQPADTASTPEDPAPEQVMAEQAEQGGDESSGTDRRRDYFLKL